MRMICGKVTNPIVRLSLMNVDTVAMVVTRGQIG